MNPTTALSDAGRQALASALDDEYESRENYRRVIVDFGPVRPCIHIVEAEARHIAALLALFTKYAVASAANRWAGQAPRFVDVHAACVAGVQGEIDNVALYDRLLHATQRPDVLQVFHALRSASQDRHLPAYRRCAQRG